MGIKNFVREATNETVSKSTMMSQDASFYTDYDRILSLQSLPIKCDDEEPQRVESNSIPNCGVIRLEDVVCGRGKVAFSHGKRNSKFYFIPR